MSPSPPNHDLGEHDWPEYRMFVVKTLESISADVSVLKGQVFKLYLKVAIIGAVFGFIGSAIPVLIEAAYLWHSSIK